VHHLGHFSREAWLDAHLLWVPDLTTLLPVSTSPDRSWRASPSSMWQEWWLAVAVCVCGVGVAGNMCGVPLAYSFQSVFVLKHGSQLDLSSTYIKALFAVLLVAYYVWDTVRVVSCGCAGWICVVCICGGGVRLCAPAPPPPNHRAPRSA
jgi:hypothetical protein